MRRVASIVVLLALLPLQSVAAENEQLEYEFKKVQERGPGGFTWGAMARDRSDLRRLWDTYHQKGPLPTIRFKKNIAVLAGTGGSSSCRARLHDLRLNRERGRVVVRMYQTAGICTDDWVPRTFTVAVARKDLKPLSPDDLKVKPRRIDDPNP